MELNWSKHRNIFEVASANETKNLNSTQLKSKWHNRFFLSTGFLNMVCSKASRNNISQHMGPSRRTLNTGQQDTSNDISSHQHIIIFYNYHFVDFEPFFSSFFSFPYFERSWNSNFSKINMVLFLLTMIGETFSVWIFFVFRISCTCKSHSMPKIEMCRFER